jgi:hypothetical protein
VELKVLLQLRKVAFMLLEDKYRAAVGATAGVDASYVSILNVTEAARRQALGLVQVHTSVVVSPTAITQLTDPTALDTNLAAAGLPNGTLTVLSVKNNTIPVGGQQQDVTTASGVSTTTLATIIGCVVGGAALVLSGACYFVRRKLWQDPNPLSKEEKDEIRKAALAETSVVKQDSKLCEAPYELKTGRPVEAARGLEHRLDVDGARLHHLIGMGVDGIVEEVTSFANSEGSGAEEKEVLELLNYILYEKAKEKEYLNGIRDKGREGVDLAYFETHDMAQEARLKPPEVRLL